METPPLQEEDAAWAGVELDVPAPTVQRLLRDPTLLLRLNPCLEFDSLQRLADGTFRIAAANESNGGRIDTDAACTIDAAGTELVLSYTTGLKRETRIRVENVDSGSRLSVTELYSVPPNGPAMAPEQVDRSLLPWMAALRRHVRRDRRFGWIPGYRRLAEGFWLSMPPRQRRVAWLIIWTTALEFAVFVAVLAVYLGSSS